MKCHEGKLDYQWEVPFVITNNLDKGLFELKQLDGDKVCLHVHYMHVHVSGFIYIPCYQPIVKRVNGAYFKKFYIEAESVPHFSCKVYVLQIH